MAPLARAWVAQKKRPVIDDPIGEMFSFCIQNGGFAVRGAAPPRQSCQREHCKTMREQAARAHNLRPLFGAILDTYVVPLVDRRSNIGVCILSPLRRRAGLDPASRGAENAGFPPKPAPA